MNTRDKINKLLEICPNYEKINSYEFLEGDKFSETMINFYTQLIDKVDMDDDEAVSFLRNLDNALGKYVLNAKLRRKVKKALVEVDTEDKYYTYKITMKLIETVESFDDNEVEVTRWI